VGFLLIRVGFYHSPTTFELRSNKTRSHASSGSNPKPPWEAAGARIRFLR
jgi:hypothetical protein